MSVIKYDHLVLAQKLLIRVISIDLVLEYIKATIITSAILENPDIPPTVIYREYSP